MLENILFMIISTVLFAFLNMRGLVDGPAPTLINFIFSLVFLIMWFFWGARQAKKKCRHYLILALIFWSIGLVISIVCIQLTGTPLLLVALAFIGPLNGIGFLMHSYGYSFVLFNTIIPLLVTALGYNYGSKRI